MTTNAEKISINFISEAEWLNYPTMHYDSVSDWHWKWHDQVREMTYGKWIMGLVYELLKYCLHW